ncbi:MAG TPA: D-alanyl-D-alanine carboxypeptidase family protein [Solirubrobacteraceae bacterium]|nr:D-alanyl-D-alanine carboxypeptidase family protein [Solirubrobacteraceae bacterium]
MRLRRVLLGAVLALLLASPCAAAQAPSGAPRLQGAEAAILIEASTGDVLLARESRQRRQIASTTKLMTALVALQQTDLDDVFSVPAYDALPVESQIGLRPGERMSVRDLLRATLLASANDAAAAIAVGTMGSVDAFVAEMNRRAAALGLRDTSFANPIGLDDEGNFSSAHDLARLAIALRRFEFFRRTVDLPSATLRSGARTRTVINRNRLVRRVDVVDGVKTGHTGRAGYVLVGSATRDGVTVVSVVLGEPSERARDADSLALLRYGLRSYEARTVMAQGRVLGRVALRYRDGEHVDVVAGATVERVLPTGARTSVSVGGVPSEVDGPLPRGTRLGTATVRRGEDVLARVPVVTARPVAEAGLGDRLDDMLARSQTVIALVLLLACSLPLLLLRRRAINRRRALDAEHRRARRREESAVP